MAHSLRLSDLPDATRAEVREIHGHPMFRSRMLALGITPRSPIRVLRRMPMGGPIEIEVRGTRLALRLSDAGRITVTVRA
jgi:ferrous iron transport protein A